MGWIGAAAAKKKKKKIRLTHFIVWMIKRGFFLFFWNKQIEMIKKTDLK